MTEGLCLPSSFNNHSFSQLPRPPHDTPYADAPTPKKASPSRDKSSHAARRSRPARKSHSAPARKSHSAAATASAPTSAAPARKKRRSARRGRGAGTTGTRVQLTSQPTSRNAYLDTRIWLLEQHGPVCAYCDRKFTARVMTLDHVAPRRGQTAYDRRDNLVLACPGCNAAKRDQAPLAFLLASRARALSLLRYGTHLSPGLLDLARALIPGAAALHAANGNGNGKSTGTAHPAADTDDGESPYRD